MRVIFGAVHYDGGTAARQDVTVTVTPSALRIELAEEAIWWPYNELTQTQGDQPGEPVRLEWGTAEDPPAIVVEDHAILDAIADLAEPEDSARFRRRKNTLRTVAIAAGGALAVGVAVFGWLIPALAGAVADKVPVEWEERLGRRVAGSLAPEALRCDDPVAVAAVDSVMARLLAALPGTRYRYTVAIARSDVINAFAAPGGSLVLHAGLLRRTERPEQLAGVLAHEIQHVELQHGTRAMIRSVPTKLVVAAIVGDATALAGIFEAASNLGALRFSRSNEAESDRAGLDLMRAARIDPSGMADFFRMLEREAGDVPAAPTYLSTHPRTANRTARLDSLAAAAGPVSVPLLPGTDWAAISARCSGDSSQDN